MSKFLDVITLIAVGILSLEGAAMYLQAGNNFFVAILFGIFCALLTGTIRDLILGRKLLWITNLWIIPVSIICALLGYFLVKKWELKI